MPRPRRAVLGLLAVTALAVVAPPAAADSPWVAPPGREALARRLVNPPGFMKPADGWVLSSIFIARGTLTYGWQRAGAPPDAPVAARLVLTPAARGRFWQPRSASFAFDVQVDPALADEALWRAVSTTRASVQARDRGGFFVLRADPEQAEPGVGGARDLVPAYRAWLLAALPSDDARVPREALYQALVALTFLAAALPLVLVASLLRRRRPRVHLDLKPTHLMPVLFQSAILGYWALYWTPARDQWLLLLPQLLFAYGFDFLLSVLLRHRWTVGFAPFPIVFSTNLFVWFEGRDFPLFFLVFAVAFASKALLRRGGRHVFNPSALGISVVAVLCYTLPAHFGYLDISHAFNAPPNMWELVLLLALIPQLRVPIVLVSLGAVAMLYLVVEVGPLPMPGALWPPVFLAIALLATDPATIPRTPAGRVLFGLWLGWLLAIASSTLDGAGENDFFAKVLVIPVANLGVRWMDRAGEVLGRWTDRVLAPRYNAAHVAVWLALVIGGQLALEKKATTFEARHHALYGTPLVRFTDSRARCEDNPVFCEPFSFAGEVRLWLHRLERARTAPAP